MNEALPDARLTGTTSAKLPKKKRAVVVVHGIGSQTPMETLRGIVEAVWKGAPPPELSGKALTWSQRDRMSGNVELWRITTNGDKKGKRTDFFEFYWADLMEDTKLASVVSWLQRLFVRGIGRVPDNLRAPWWFGWAMVVALLLMLLAVGGLAIAALHAIPNSPFVAAERFAVAVALLLLLWYLRRHVLIEVVGDAARYLTPAPENIGARSRIRRAGLDLLRALHRSQDYDRIVVVSHSLGSVVAYDMLSLCWSEVHDAFKHPKSGPNPALEAIERAAADVLLSRSEKTLKAFRDAQAGYFKELQEISPESWKISDFVTVGSPLAHAHLLLVNDGAELMESERKAIGAEWLAKWWSTLTDRDRTVASMFRARAAQREYALCPSITETGNAFVYDPKKGDCLVPHHAAVFAPVRWTNIHAPRRWVLWGDVIGGPLAPLFGPGVRDVELTGAAAGSFVAHVNYWKTGFADDTHLMALRAAVNLAGELDSVVWPDQPTTGHP